MLIKMTNSRKCCRIFKS